MRDEITKLSTQASESRNPAELAALAARVLTWKAQISGSSKIKMKSSSISSNIYCGGSPNMEREMTQEITSQLKKLRDPFKPNQISQLPKPYKKDSQKGNCSVCGGFHGLPAMHLDYVGHAALTDRLLDVDPLWTWEPVAFDTHGLPALDNNGGLWIKLTICGVTRLGYGDAEGKTGGIAMKERIGDALRNAAMRFGAALDLWHKGDLHGDDEQEATATETRQPDTKSVKHPDNAFDPQPDAEILAQFNAAKNVTALTKVMNSLPQGDRILYTGHYNQCLSNLKKAA